MGMDCRSDIIAGAYQPELVTVETVKEIVTRYDEKTGKPYEKEIISEVVRVGNTEVDDVSEVFEYLEDKLDFLLLMFE